MSLYKNVEHNVVDAKLQNSVSFNSKDEVNGTENKKNESNGILIFYR